MENNGTIIVTSFFAQREIHMDDVRPMFAFIEGVKNVVRGKYETNIIRNFLPGVNITIEKVK